MARDNRYDVLFEPVKIGPVTSRNCFFQATHCNGMGIQYPRTQAAMRATKGEGGWGVICTEECLLHMSADVMPITAAFLYDDDDIPAMARSGAAAGTRKSSRPKGRWLASAMARSNRPASSPTSARPWPAARWSWSRRARPMTCSNRAWRPIRPPSITPVFCRSRRSVTAWRRQPSPRRSSRATAMPANWTSQPPPTCPS